MVANKLIPTSCPDLTVLYGSQTGNAEDMSKRIGKQAKSLGLSILVKTMDDFPLKQLPTQKLIIFVCSTTGHGQEPENMKNLYNFIRRRDLPKTCLSNLKFAVYGLGDSSYSKFNYVSKILYKRLKECGAQPVQELVMGDEQHSLGCDGIIYPKLNELWIKLGRIDEKYDMLESSYNLEIYEEDEIDSPGVEFETAFLDNYDMKTGYCTTNQKLTPESHFQDTRLICFKTDCVLDYEPGDVCTIFPQNSEESVYHFLTTLNLDPNKKIGATKKDKNYMVNYLYDFIPRGLKIQDLVRHYLDIQSVPKRSFFEYLWPFSQDELEKTKLKEFASTEGQEELYEYCVQPKRSILEVLLDFPNTVKNIKFDYLLDLIPPIKPRSFSIASSCRLHPKEVHLIVGVVKYQTRLRKIRKGLCSNYLSGIAPIKDGHRKNQNNIVRFFIKRTSFKLPSNDSTPIVMVGPGLGIAPFRSFIQERIKQGSTRNYLYFGCRYKSADFYFEKELTQYSSNDALSLRVAFSRENSKQYVQDLLLEDAELLKNLIEEQGAIIYVAGNSKLPENLRKLLINILSKEEGDSEHDSHVQEHLVTNLEANNRVQYDCW